MKKLLFLALIIGFTGIYANYDMDITDREPYTSENWNYPVNKEYSTYEDRELAGPRTYSTYDNYPTYRTGSPLRRTAQGVVEGAEEIAEAPLNLIP